MSLLRLAVIGAGHLGRIHVRLARSLPEVEVVAVVDVSAAVRRDIATEFDVPTVADYRALVGRIDAAIIATPTSTHSEVGADLLEAGVPVFIEKPLASSLSEADRLVRKAAGQGLVLQVGHVERFNPAFEAANGLLEDVKYISAERISGYPARSTDIGVVLDLMIHDLDICLAVTGAKVRRVDAIGATVVGPHEDIATARLVFENGCVANLTASRVSFVTRRQMDFFMPAGQVSIDFAAKQANLVAYATPAQKEEAALGSRRDCRQASGEGNLLAAYLQRRALAVADSNAISQEQKEFIACVRARSQPRATGAAGRDALALAELVLDSIGRHQWDGHALGRIGPRAVQSTPILRPATWQKPEGNVAPQRAAS